MTYETLTSWFAYIYLHIIWNYIINEKKGGDNNQNSTSRGHYKNP